MATPNFSSVYAQLDAILPQLWGLRPSTPDEVTASIEELAKITETLKTLRKKLRKLEDDQHRSAIKVEHTMWAACWAEIEQILQHLSECSDDRIRSTCLQDTVRRLRRHCVKLVGCKLQKHLFNLHVTLGEPIEYLHVLPTLNEEECSLGENLNSDLGILRREATQMSAPPPSVGPRPFSPLQPWQCSNLDDHSQPPSEETECEQCIHNTQKLEHKSQELDEARKHISRLREEKASYLKKIGDFGESRRIFQALFREAEKHANFELAHPYTPEIQQRIHPELIRLENEIVTCLIAENHPDAGQRAERLLGKKYNILKSDDISIMETLQQLGSFYSRKPSLNLRKAEHQYTALWHLRPEGGFPPTFPWPPQYDLILTGGEELAAIYLEQNRPVSEYYFRQVWEAKKAAFGPANPKTLQTALKVISTREPADVTNDLDAIWSAININFDSDALLPCEYELGMCFFKHHRHPQAVKILRPLWIKKQKKVIDLVSSNDLNLAFCLGQALYLQWDPRKYEEARDILNKVWIALMHFLPPNSQPSALEVGQHLVSVLKLLESWSDAKAIQNRVYEMKKDAPDSGPDHLEALDAQYSLAQITSHLAPGSGNLETTTTMFGEVFDVCRAKTKENANPQKKEFLQRAVQCGYAYAKYLLKQKLDSQAVDVLQKTWDLRPSVRPNSKENSSILLSGLFLGKTLIGLGRHDEAIPIAEVVWKDRNVLVREGTANIFDIGLMYGQALLDSVNARQAEILLRQAWGVKPEVPADECTRQEVGILVGTALCTQERYVDARNWLIELKNQQGQSKDGAAALHVWHISEKIAYCHWMLKEYQEAKRVYEAELNARKQRGENEEAVRALKEELERLKKELKAKAVRRTTGRTSRR